ncbi:MAG: hypothetical protein ABI217_08180, partial [Chthoniobacterales bacterium]
MAGAVGAYPLQWSRTMNGRRLGTDNLGAGGGWSHSYQWRCSADGYLSAYPDVYTVTFPDGRVVRFNHVTPSNVSPLGVGDRMGGGSGTGYVYLLMAGGGQVRFYQRATYYPQDPSWSFTVDPPDQVIDPNGLVTTLTYDTSSRLIQVTEPAGRYLIISYGTNGYISEVDAYTAAGHLSQWVTYTYATQTFGGVPYVVLTRATYIGSPAPIAYYTYQTSNLSASGTPLISTCKDVRYPGPMKNIGYAFVRTNPLSYGELSQEQNANGTPVVTLTVNGTTRTETRNDASGASRTWTYGATPSGGSNLPYLLKTFTDFAAHTTTLGYDANAYVNSVTDSMVPSRTTSFVRLALTGAISKITHPGDASTIQYFFMDPTTGYHLEHVTDELNHSTYYHYNANMTTSEIDYLDGGIEKFTYNGFNEVLTHTMPSNTGVAGTGGTENYSYDSTGLLLTHTPPGSTSDPSPSP